MADAGLEGERHQEAGQQEEHKIQSPQAEPLVLALRLFIFQQVTWPMGLQLLNCKNKE